jgi:hypothetical protein
MTVARKGKVHEVWPELAFVDAIALVAVLAWGIARDFCSTYSS